MGHREQSFTSHAHHYISLHSACWRGRTELETNGQLGGAFLDGARRRAERAVHPRWINNAREKGDGTNQGASSQICWHLQHPAVSRWDAFFFVSCGIHSLASITHIKERVKSAKSSCSAELAENEKKVFSWEAIRVILPTSTVFWLKVLYSNYNTERSTFFMRKDSSISYSSEMFCLRWILPKLNRRVPATWWADISSTRTCLPKGSKCLVPYTAAKV